MFTKQYGWYIENGQLAIVEASSDGESQWDTISTTGRTVKLITKCLPTDFDTNLDDSTKTINIPSMFRRTIADLAISRFYEMPPFSEASIPMARHFYAKYNEGLKEIKVYANRDFTGAEQIVPHYF